MSRFERPVSMDDVKRVASRDPRAAGVLKRVLDMRRAGVGWYLGGRKPEEGFDSPGFAAFVLGELLLIPRSPADRERELGTWLREQLREVPEPRNGDLVFYKSGYAMFYYDPAGDSPFVIGMTPFGITALRPEFGERVGVWRFRD